VVKAAHKPDRRVERTRRVVMDAFRELLFECGYARMTVRDIIDRADVGRSTFYEHFESKEDVLRQSLSPVFTPLADTIGPAHDFERLRLVVEHFWHGRRLTSATFTGAARDVLSGYLAELIAERLDLRRRGSGGAAPLLPLPLVAAYLAEAQLSLFERWFRETNPCAPDTIARAFYAGINALTAALLNESA
jgi:AcrR family transcriptional regulator